MSWSIEKVGTSEEVKAVVLGDGHMPQQLKDAIVLFLDAGKENSNVKPPAAVRFKSAGHYDKDGPWSNVYNLLIEPLAVDPRTDPNVTQQTK